MQRVHLNSKIRITNQNVFNVTTVSDNQWHHFVLRSGEDTSTFLFPSVFVCDFACFITFTPLTFNDSYLLLMFLYYLFCLVVLTHFRLHFFAFGSTVECLFCYIVFLSFLLLLFFLKARCKLCYSSSYINKMS